MPGSRLCFVVESGVDVRLVEGLGSMFDLTILARKIEGGVEVSHPPAHEVAMIEGPASRAGFARFAARHLWAEREAYDAVLVQGYSLAALSANLVARRTGVPTTMLVCSPTEAYYLCRSTNPQPNKPFRAHELWTLRLLARLNAAVGQRYITLSEHLSEVVRAHGGTQPIDIIPVYGVDTRIFHPPSEPKPELKKQLGLPPGGTLVFFSSRIAPEKDSQTLLAATRRLLDAGHDLWILHRSGGFRSFEHDAARFGVAERVIATDAVHPHRELPLDYRACDLCVQASRAEGLGFSPLEALASEVPVIATAVGGLRETVLDGRTGWSYPVGDVDALVRCMEAVLHQPEEAGRRAVEGRRLVVERYDSRRAFERLRDALICPPRDRTPSAGPRG
jgi:glycosyltransferase involved in cell wall biosynthesis